MYGVATDKDRLHSRGGGLRGGHQNDRDNRLFCDRPPLPSAVSAAAIFGVSAFRPIR